MTKKLSIDEYLETVALPAPRGRMAAPAPVFAPGPWNTNEMQELANCYAYAAQFFPTEKNWFPQPGERATVADEPTVSDIFNKVAADGLIPVAADKATPVKGYYLVALFEQADRETFHFYRQDADGTWSHKDGEGLAARTDLNGDLIADPRKAARPEWAKNFISYFYVPNEGLKFPDRAVILTRAQYACPRVFGF